MTKDSSRRLRLGLWVASGVVIVVSAVAIVLAVQRDGADETTSAAPVLRVATQLPDPMPVPDLSAPDVDGVTVPLVKTAPGRLSLLYFGYTNCPDICPLDMASLAAALRELPADQRSKIRVVFSTVDPERDTAAVLKPWLANHDPAFIGVMPPLDATNATLESLGYAKVARESMPDGNGYAVSHPAGVYVYTDDGLAHVAFFGTNPPQDMAHDLLALLEGKGRTAGADSGPAATPASTATATGRITVSDARIPVPANPGVASVYLRVRNASPGDDVLESVTTSAGGEAELHRSTMENGSSMMRAAGPVTVKRGATLTLEPGGLHVMIMDPTAPLAVGDRVSVTLRFRDAGEITVEATVVKPTDVVGAGGGAGGGEHGAGH